MINKKEIKEALQILQQNGRVMGVRQTYAGDIVYDIMKNEKGEYEIYLSGKRCWGREVTKSIKDVKWILQLCDYWLE